MTLRDRTITGITIRTMAAGAQGRQGRRAGRVILRIVELLLARHSAVCTTIWSISLLIRFDGAKTPNGSHFDDFAVIVGSANANANGDAPTASLEGVISRGLERKVGVRMVARKRGQLPCQSHAPCQICTGTSQTPPSSWQWSPCMPMNWLQLAAIQGEIPSKNQTCRWSGLALSQAHQATNVWSANALTP